ncbi:hypothetical protein DKT77_17125 [Meridianimarinicoccus roseus]|uniref:Uncharacterized protein n=1 Tax=Meridianimarinicoccus roseus TaxID=2072018 RepID=A0A2V2L7J5_9RHOB|nr:hypothetical protein [Meridianimarinicoccus roseus]PWR01428.1 hypothetical protein DKT77_17125 [Meridianimarinicoccus roseus]
MVRHVNAFTAVKDYADADEAAKRKTRNSKTRYKFKNACPTDPNASMGTNGPNRHPEPGYKQHYVVEDQAGVVLDVFFTTGEVNEGEPFLARLDAVPDPYRRRYPQRRG